MPLSMCYYCEVIHVKIGLMAVLHEADMKAAHITSLDVNAKQKTSS